MSKRKIMTEADWATKRCGQVLNVAGELSMNLVKRIEALEKEKKELTRDYNHAYKCWRACAANLREAREKNRQLWLKLSAREVGRARRE